MAGSPHTPADPSSSARGRTHGPSRKAAAAAAARQLSLHEAPAALGDQTRRGDTCGRPYSPREIFQLADRIAPVLACTSLHLSPVPRAVHTVHWGEATPDAALQEPY